MKIKKLKLKNIGSYTDEQFFSFDIDEPSRNIILIGGRNGAGKTTLFESIRICLYGYKLYGYRQNSQTYTNRIKSLINDNAKKELLTSASINMQILVENGYTNNIFDITRNWILEGNRLKEEYIVHKDSHLLDDEELQDFDNFLLQTIPPALFSFHFFNGENISEFLFDKTTGQSFQKAFMQLCGLDTFDLLEEQLQNSIRLPKDGVSLKTQEDYTNAKQALRCVSTSYENASKQVVNVQEEIASLEDQVVILDNKMAQFGGVGDNEWGSFQETLKQEELKREDLRRFLKDAANDIIPFVILKKELANLKEQLHLETELRKNKVLREKLFDNQTKNKINEKLNSYFSNNAKELPDDFFNTLYDVMKEDCIEDKAEFLCFSESEHMDLLAKINLYVDYDFIKIVNAEKGIVSSLNKMKRLRNKMDSKEILDSQKYLEQKNDLLIQLAEKQQELYEIKIQKLQYEETLKITNQKYEKAYEAFKATLKEKSVTDMSSRALLAFGELKQSLYTKYVSMVERSFSLNFRRLITKADLLDGIYISSLFEVIAYKKTDVDVNSVLKQLTDFGEEFMRNLLGERAFQMIIESGLNTGTISVPLKVEQHFSAGEKQIFVMALYQSLSEIRTVELPFVIDTPLARIDSEHRKNILLHFFAKLPGQVMIFSTDEEINEDGISLLQDKLSDVYLIEHQTKGISKARKNVYFKEANS